MHSTDNKILKLTDEIKVIFAKWMTENNNSLKKFLLKAKSARPSENANPWPDVCLS